jgi:hypothetical protein
MRHRRCYRARKNKNENYRSTYSHLIVPRLGKSLPNRQED